MSRGSNQLKVKEWTSRFERFGKSGQSATQFCEAEGISTPSFYRWRRKLGRSAKGRKGRRRSTRRRASRPSAFKPVMARAVKNVALLVEQICDTASKEDASHQLGSPCHGL